MFCSGCGKSLNDNAKFCPSCGKKVLSTENAPTSVTTPKAPVQAGGDAVYYILFFANVVFALIPFYRILGFDSALGIEIDGIDTTFSVYSIAKLLRKALFGKEARSTTLSDSGFMIVLVIIGIFILCAFAIIFLVSTVKKYYYEDFNRARTKIDILLNIRTAAIFSFSQCMVILISMIIISNEVDRDRELVDYSFSFLFWICLLGSFLSIVFISKKTEAIGREDYAARTSTRNDSWVCTCGARNASAQSFCKNCSRSRKESESL